MDGGGAPGFFKGAACVWEGVEAGRGRYPHENQCADSIACPEVLCEIVQIEGLGRDDHEWGGHDPGRGGDSDVHWFRRRVSDEEPVDRT